MSLTPDRGPSADPWDDALAAPADIDGYRDALATPFYPWTASATAVTAGASDPTSATAFAAAFDEDEELRRRAIAAEAAARATALAEQIAVAALEPSEVTRPTPRARPQQARAPIPSGPPPSAPAGWQGAAGSRRIGAPRGTMPWQGGAGPAAGRRNRRWGSRRSRAGGAWAILVALSIIVANVTRACGKS